MSNEKKNDGGPAFPMTIQHITDTGVWPETIPGMTLRDYFAAKAMQALASVHNQHGVPTWAGRPDNNDMAAHEAYSMADSMLKAREQ